jgi:hypothetical protein
MTVEGRAFAVSLAVALTVAPPRSARAEPPAPALMAKLAEHAEAFEKMRNRAGYAIAGELDEKDSDGKTTSIKTGSARVLADGHAVHVVVDRYVEDGKDMTAEAQKRAREADAKRAHRTDEERLHMPFQQQEQAKYTFDEVEHDPVDTARVRITFVPKDPTEHTIEGSAWVDTTTGHLVSAGFKVSRTPFFVDFIHFTVEFGIETSLGPAVSKVTVDGGGGVWFFHKHFVGTASLSEYHISPY